MNVLVTGASRGIGYEIVKSLSQEKGHQILAVSRSKDRLEKLAVECRNNPSKVHIIDADLNRNDELETVAGFIGREFKHLDILINNAGLLVNKPFESLTNDDFVNVINTNLRAPMNLIRLLLPFLAKGSHVVNLGSMGGVQGSVKFAGLSLYSTSKGALAILTECLAEEFKEKEVSFNCLAIGAAQTEMLEEAFPGYQAPLSAEEMGGFIADFALTGHRFFNGKILPVAVSTP